LVESTDADLSVETYGLTVWHRFTDCTYPDRAFVIRKRFLDAAAGVHQAGARRRGRFTSAASSTNAAATVAAALTRDGRAPRIRTAIRTRFRS